MSEIKLEKARKVKGVVQIEHYDNGELGIILPKVVREKFDEIFRGRAIDVSLDLAEQDRKIVIVIDTPKKDYIA